MLKKKVSRRDFLKSAGGVAGGLLVVALPGALRGLAPQTAAAKGSSESGAKAAGAKAVSSKEVHNRYWGFVVDTERCIGCGKCVRACKQENSVPWEPEY